MTQRILMFASLILLFACKKENPAPTGSSGTGTTPVISTMNTIAFTFGTQNVKLQSGKNDYYFGSTESWYSGFPSDSVTASFTCFIDKYPYTGAGFTLTFRDIEVLLADFDNNSDAMYDSVFKIGERSFSYSNPMLPMVSIGYTQEDGTVWNCFGLQPEESYFKLTSSHDAVVNGIKVRTLKGNFSCRMNDSNGNERDITNAAFYFNFRIL